MQTAVEEAGRDDGVVRIKTTTGSTPGGVLEGDRSSLVTVFQQLLVFYVRPNLV